MSESSGGHQLALHDRGGTLEAVVRARELFWRNVMREILTSLSVASMERAGRRGEAAGVGEAAEAEALFDGRLAVLTEAGERIPIAEVHPLFACGIQGSDSDRALSAAVECSVFQIRTPSGEVFTLPLREMRGFHSVSSELMERLEAEARRGAGGAEGSEVPFGFAAFTSLARQGEDEESA